MDFVRLSRFTTFLNIYLRQIKTFIRCFVEISINSCRPQRVTFDNLALVLRRVLGVFLVTPLNKVYLFEMLVLETRECLELDEENLTAMLTALNYEP